MTPPVVVSAIGALLVVGALGACGASSAESSDDTRPHETTPGSVAAPGESAAVPTTTHTDEPDAAPPPSGTASATEHLRELGRNPLPWTGSDERLPLEHFVDAFIEAACRLTLECPIGYAGLDAVYYGNVERCRVALWQRSGERLSAMKAAAEAGRFAYDEAGGAYCVRELARACGAINNGYPEVALDGLCASVFDGNVPAGGNCNSHEECLGDAECSGTTGCTGICEPLVPLGGSCKDHEDCSGFGYYDAFCDESLCASVAEEAPAPLGESCGAETWGGQYRLCEEGLVCREYRGGHDIWYECDARLDVGDACPSPGSMCQPGLFCFGSPDGELTCQERTLAEPGGSCDEAALCDVLEHQGCEDGTCVAKGDGSEGSWCQTGSQSGCRNGTRCAVRMPPSATCETPYDDGAGCRNDADCKSDRCLDVGDHGECDRRYCSVAPYPESAR